MFFFLVLLFSVARCDDWSVRLDSSADADAIAKEHGLFNAGEVLPDSGIYHFRLMDKQPHSRSKRSTLTSIHSKLSSHPSLKDVELHDEPLVRVKRGPLNDLKVRHFVKRQSGGELCFVNTLPTRTRESKRCVFPFNYKDTTYLRCTTDHSSNKKEWCATEVRNNGDVIEGQWGDCDTESVSCFSINEKQPSRSQGQLPPRSFPPQSPGNLPPPPRGRPFDQPPTSGRRPPPFLPPPPERGQSQRRPPHFGADPRFHQGPPGRFPPPPGGFNGRPPPGGFPQFPPVPPRFPPSPVVDNEVIEVDPADLKTQADDDLWTKMWFLNRGDDGMDMNVEESWAQGLTGKGVKVTILDDGIEHSHDDLKDNYDQRASVDLNDEDSDPFPRYDFINSNKHGTRCAGTVAAKANNSFCAVGIANNAKIGGVRILDGQISDMLEARALSFNRDYVDIYSASWGPDDNGAVVDGPGPLTAKALRDGVTEGRDGKGSIFVWASGNGGKALDNCNCDGYTTSIYTLSVSSASENGLIPWYSESCSSSLATTYSSGSKRLNERKVVTTDLHNKCTDQHTGTSASSPMAAGIVALTLEANPALTWRDVQHLTVRSARPRGNLKARDWNKNGVGLEFSHAFGFGLMDSGKMTKLAKDWQQVPAQVKCTTPKSVLSSPVEIPPDSNVTVRLNAESCNHIKFIEQIHLHVDLNTLSPRGKLTVMLRSPMETNSVLLAPRPMDNIRQGLSRFSAWPMMSVHFWGEPVATSSSSEEATPTSNSGWTLYVRNGGDRVATLNDFQITFYGTEEDPQPGVPLVMKDPINLEPEVDQSDVTTFLDSELLSFLAQAEADDVSTESDLDPVNPDLDPEIFGTPVDFEIPSDIVELIEEESNKSIETS